MRTIQSFGAVASTDPGGALLNDAAFAAAASYLAGCPDEIAWDAGTYCYSSSPNWAISHSSHRARGPVRLQLHANTLVHAFVASGPSEGAFDVRWRGDFIIEAPPTAGCGAFINRCHHSEFELFVRGCGTPASALYTMFCVCTNFPRFRATVNEEGWYLDAKPAMGITVGDTTDPEGLTCYCTWDQPIIEGCGNGVRLTSHAWGNTFRGGTIEGNSGYGANFDAGSLNNRMYGVDFESNSAGDVILGGKDNVLEQCDTASVVTLSGVRPRLIGGMHQTISLDPAAVSPCIFNPTYNRFGGGGITGSCPSAIIRDPLDGAP